LELAGATNTVASKHTHILELLGQGLELRAVSAGLAKQTATEQAVVASGDESPTGVNLSGRVSGRDGGFFRVQGVATLSTASCLVLHRGHKHVYFSFHNFLVNLLCQRVVLSSGSTRHSFLVASETTRRLRFSVSGSFPQMWWERLFRGAAFAKHLTAYTTMVLERCVAHLQLRKSHPTVLALIVRAFASQARFRLGIEPT